MIKKIPLSFQFDKRQQKKTDKSVFFYGASNGNRTSDTGIFSPLLYQLSYRGLNKKMATWNGLEPSTSSVTG